MEDTAKEPGTIRTNDYWEDQSLLLLLLSAVDCGAFDYSYNWNIYRTLPAVDDMDFVVVAVAVCGLVSNSRNVLLLPYYSSTHALFLDQ